MANFGMAEQYGIACSDTSQRSFQLRDRKFCPFRGSGCNKAGGVCSISDGATVTITCPNRFLEKGILFDTVCDSAFGSRRGCIAVGEVDFLRAVNEARSSVGKIDNVVAQVHSEQITNWCALEIQAVYFSGYSMNSEVRHFEKTHSLAPPGSRRPDYRSSGPKRLLPQLEVKVPTLRRWGKKMFVAIDEPFYQWMPPMKCVDDISNADICWLIFRLVSIGKRFELRMAQALYTTLEESRESLVGAQPPPKPEFEEMLMQKLAGGSPVVWRSATTQGRR